MFFLFLFPISFVLPGILHSIFYFLFSFFIHPLDLLSLKLHRGASQRFFFRQRRSRKTKDRLRRKRERETEMKLEAEAYFSEEKEREWRGEKTKQQKSRRPQTGEGKEEERGWGSEAETGSPFIPTWKLRPDSRVRWTSSAQRGW